MSGIRISRRRFVGGAAATVAGGFFVNPQPARPSQSANERLNIAAVGATNRAAANISAVASQNIVAIADVDGELLEKGSQNYPAARKYRDFRQMLEKEGDKLEAVVVSTPDHTHAPAAAMALRMKKHVYCEKPLTHTVYEARVLAQLARENNLVTQMGTQIHAGDNYRRVVELIEQKAIGTVQEVHVWVPAIWTGAKFEPAEKPPHLDWDLWLGPAPDRPYCKGIHPFYWRRFWEYGSGALGDFGCHYLDLVHWALKLRHPVRVTAKGPPVDEVSCPAWLIVEYEYPARGDLPPVKVTWYDGGKQPEILSTLRDGEGRLLEWRAGQLFIGTEGMLISEYSRHMLLPVEKFRDYKRPDPYIPASIGHHAEWLEAIRSGGTTTCNFDYSGALTETVLLGTVAYRAGESLEWDAEAFRIKNSEKAQQLLHKEYRKGWVL
ncbi:MAG: oxidoreductase [Pirellulaceae bacterium]|nr:MAG: oxidoreductase [Pirellulaceae bacterium]